MKAVPFFADTIKLRPHSATEAKLLEKSVSIREFAAGERVSLYELEGGDLLCRKQDGTFMEGPEVS